MEFDPPVVQVRDLGSRNGTFVNGTRIELSPPVIPDLANPDRPGVLCTHGDLITIGGTTMRVEMVECPHTVNDAEGKPGWEGVPVKKDCQLPCEKVAVPA
jgi:pSer/pThr/pTyr-binding forkhead associated (FHA) protein